MKKEQPKKSTRGTKEDDLAWSTAVVPFCAFCAFLWLIRSRFIANALFAGSAILHLDYFGLPCSVDCNYEKIVILTLRNDRIFWSAERSDDLGYAVVVSCNENCLA